MRYLWVDEGNDPDYTKGDRDSINGYFFALFDPRLNPGYLQAVRQKGYAVGVYMAWNWPQYVGKSGAQMAEITVARVKQIAGGFLSNSMPKVQYDIEAHDPALIAACLTRHRELLPQQDTSWTMESFQGGWMDPVFVKAMLACKVRVVPQLYSGQMANIGLRDSNPALFWRQIAAERVAEDVALKDLLKRGFPQQIISGFYDAASLPQRWDGWAFTQGRLP